MIMKLFGADDQIHCKNKCVYSKVVKFIVKNDVLWRGYKNEQFIEQKYVFEKYGVWVVSGSARFGTARLESARFGSARLGSARPVLAQLGSARLGSVYNSL